MTSPVPDRQPRSAMRTAILPRTHAARRAPEDQVLLQQARRQKLAGLELRRRSDRMPVAQQNGVRSAHAAAAYRPISARQASFSAVGRNAASIELRAICVSSSLVRPSACCGGEVVLADVAAEIGRVVRVDRHAQPRIEQALAGCAAPAARKPRSFRLDSGHTVSGTLVAREPLAPARGSSSQRTPWSMRSTFSIVERLARCTPAGLPRRRARPSASPAARARANTRANFDGGLPARTSRGRRR